MLPEPHDGTCASPRRKFAQAACLCFGIALVIWGFAPAIVERLVTGSVPSWRPLALGAGSVLVGLTFIGLQCLISRGLRWALWVAFLLALALATAGVALTLCPGTPRASIFSLILAASVTVGSWLALAESRQSHSRAAA
jgi:lysylphosphatidylglycerol synthetase-like protein (DUF2156 family)